MNDEIVGVFLRHLELAVAIVGLLVIAAGALAFQGVPQSWVWVSAWASLVGLSQMLFIWTVRSKERSARDQTIVEVQTMLKDVINNQLVVIQMADQINRRKPGSVPQRAVERSVSVISDAIASLSQDSLQAWTEKYRSSARRIDTSGLGRVEASEQLKKKLEAIVPTESPPFQTRSTLPSPDGPSPDGPSPDEPSLGDTTLASALTTSLTTSPHSSPVSSPVSSQDVPYSDVRQVTRDLDAITDESITATQEGRAKEK